MVEGWIMTCLMLFHTSRVDFCECVLCLYASRLSFRKVSHQRLADTRSKHQNSTNSLVACSDRRIDAAKEVKL